MKNLTTTLLLLLAFVVIQAQDYKFGKVSKEELNKKQSEIDADSPAEILYEKSSYTIRYDAMQDKIFLEKELEGRIKIYDKDKTPEQFLNKEIELYTPSSDRDKMTSLKAVTYNLVGGKIEESKVKNSDIFKEENKYQENEKFAFPNVKNGSVLEYKYSVVSPFYWNIDRWYFQTEIPVVHSEFTFGYPEYFIFTPDERGGMFSKKKKNSISDLNSNFKLNYITHELNNIKGLKREPFVLNPNNLKASIRYELAQFSIPGRIPTNYATSWTQIGKDLYDHSKVGRQLNGNGFLDETVNSIIAGKSTDEDKAQAIFNYVKENMVWNRTRGIYVENGVRKAFKDKVGNSADINLLLVSMLQKANLNASPVVLSTVYNGMLNYSFPSLMGLDFLIASVEINGQIHLMDATEKQSEINMLPWYDLNIRGFRIQPSGADEVTLVNYTLSNINEVLIMELSPDCTKAKVKYTETKDKYFAMTDNINRSDDEQEFKTDYLEDYTFDLTDFKILENDSGAVRYSFNVEELPVGESVGGKVFINPLQFIKYKQHNFNYETRNYPLEFGSPINHVKKIIIKIPEGYKVENLPENKQFVLENNVAVYAYQIRENDGQLEVVTQYQLGQSILPPSFYQPIKEFFNQRITAEDQQVVLVKQ